MSANAQIAAIRAATQMYLDGLYDGDADKIATVFLPSSALTQSYENELKVVPRDEWLNAVRNRPSPKAQGMERHARPCEGEMPDAAAVLHGSAEFSEARWPLGRGAEGVHDRNAGMMPPFSRLREKVSRSDG
jgi:Putative lumazine-binding